MRSAGLRPVSYTHLDVYKRQGLSGEEIPIEARIISIADAFDAMTSFRRYRHNFTAEEAKAEIRRCTGTQFDPVVAKVALRALERFEDIKNDPKWVCPVDENNNICLLYTSRCV